MRILLVVFAALCMGIKGCKDMCSMPGRSKKEGELGVEIGKPNAAHNRNVLCLGAKAVRNFR